MKSSTFFGIILGLLAIFGAFLWEKGPAESLFLGPPMLIVFGGTFFAALAGSSFQQMAKLPKLLYIAIFPHNFNVHETISEIVKFSYIARREGILGIETKLHEVKHPFLKKLYKICIDGADPETYDRIVETEIAFITERHNLNISLFAKMAGFSPTMGIIGTVMGLIATLAAAGQDPNILIHNIATAFIATMWGILMANVVWLPIADKLKFLHTKEMLLFQVMIEGVNSIQMGETPSVIRSKLISALPLSEQETILDEKMPSYKDIMGSSSSTHSSTEAQKSDKSEKNNK